MHIFKRAACEWIYHSNLLRVIFRPNLKQRIKFGSLSFVSYSSMAVTLYNPPI